VGDAEEAEGAGDADVGEGGSKRGADGPIFLLNYFGYGAHTALEG
jgi:hypothetical protein